MPQNSTPAPRPLVHTVARILFLCVVGAIALVVATAPTQQQGMFNPGADLDTTNVTYLGFQPGEVGLAAGADVLEYGPSAQAAEVPCSTDYECAVVELGQALLRGEQIHEDLSFTGASELYSANNDLLTDAFWAEFAPMDWDGAKYFLGLWVDQQLA